MTDGAPIEATEAQAGPTNLEEALKALRNNDSQAAPQPVDTASVGEEGNAGVSGELLESQVSTQPQGARAPEIGAVADSAQGDQQPEPVLSGIGGEAGGLATAVEQPLEGSGLVDTGYTPQDYQDLQSQLSRSVQLQALNDARDYFKEQGIEKASINQLYQRDDNGRVTFTNPDDPNRPFTSRQEAQQWIDSYNAQVDAEFRKYANQLYGQYGRETMPAMRLMQFAPIYDQMSKQAQEVMDTLIEPYSVRDKSGAVVGFSCDLNAAKAQAEALCQKFGVASSQVTPPAQEAGAKPAGGPALDMTTSGSATTPNEEPKNLQEAMAMLNKQSKKKGK